jgi:hypothetical protein
MRLAVEVTILAELSLYSIQVYAVIYSFRLRLDIQLVPSWIYRVPMAPSSLLYSNYSTGTVGAREWPFQEGIEFRPSFL